jgi:hypothetical protein
MKTKSANVQVITLDDGREVCLSYGVIVAAFIPHDCAYRRLNVRGYVKTDARFSVTTSRHANQYAGKDAREIPHAELLLLCAPITSKQ